MMDGMKARGIAAGSVGENDWRGYQETSLG